MPRQPLIIGQINDAYGDPWDVRERRETQHGFCVYLGWPVGIPRGRGGSGGPRVVLTTELVAHLERHRQNSYESMQLPIGRQAIARLRRELGHHRYLDAAAWWEERVDDLSDLNGVEFARKHGVSKSMATQARRALLGKRDFREPGWYREPSAIEALTSIHPAHFVATFLGTSVGSVRRLRSVLRAEGYEQPDGMERLVTSKRGLPAHPNTRKGLLKAARRNKTKSHRGAISRALKTHYENGGRPGTAGEDYRPWTPREDRKLGTAPDELIAKGLSRDVRDVRERRKKLGIPGHQ